MVVNNFYGKNNMCLIIVFMALKLKIMIISGIKDSKKLKYKSKLKKN